MSARGAAPIWFATLLVTVAALAGCGFQMRGAVTLPFDAIVIEPRTEVANQLARALQVGSGARVLRERPAPEDVDGSGQASAAPETRMAWFDILSESQEKAILSLNSAGRPREYQLRYRAHHPDPAPRSALQRSGAGQPVRRAAALSGHARRSGAADPAPHAGRTPASPRGLTGSWRSCEPMRSKVIWRERSRPSM
jgi:hypothetical protein